MRPDVRLERHTITVGIYEVDGKARLLSMTQTHFGFRLRWARAGVLSSGCLDQFRSDQNGATHLSIPDSYHRLTVYVVHICRELRLSVLRASNTVRYR